MKKVSLFLATPVRQRAEKDAYGFGRSPCFLNAIRIHADLIEARLQGGLDDETIKKIGGGGTAKVFGRGWHESVLVEKAVREAWRIESSVEEFSPPGSSDNLKVEIKFYPKSSGQECSFRLTFWLGMDGVIFATSYSDPVSKIQN